MPYDDITSLQRLHCYQLPTSYADADIYLRQRWETVQLLAIHQHYFPTKLPTGWAKDQDKLLPTNENTFSEAELNCIKLLDGNELFPFALDHLLEVAEEGERLSTIPLQSFGIDRWDCPFSEFEPGWQMMLQLAEPIDEEGVAELGVEVLEILGQATRTGRVSLIRMKELCQSEEEPLCFLSTAMHMIDHSTENAFLDPTNEMPCEDMFWDQEDVALLVQHWKDAQTMIAQTDALAEWLATDPQHLRKAVDLWNKSMIA